MSYDGIVTKAVAEELNEVLLGGRIDKIYQQENDEILISVRNKRDNHRLILSASSNNPRAYLSRYSKKNPEHPPVFCMLLRKHLIGGIVLDIGQLSLDRIIYIDISALDELGMPTEKRLLIEIMGKHSNIILLDRKTGKILDSIKRISENISSLRQVLPGLIYQLPPVGNKNNPLDIGRDEFYQIIDGSNKNQAIYKFLYGSFLGLSPLISREICFTADLDIDRTILSLADHDLDSFFDGFSLLMEKVKSRDYSFNAIGGQKHIKAFHALRLDQFGGDNRKFYPSMSQLLDEYYHRKDIVDRLGQKSQSIRRLVQVKLDRAVNKLVKQKEELLSSQDREKYKVYADLISANIHKIPKGAESIPLDNFYDINMEKILIPLDISLSPVLNAQRYYKRYSKLKNAHLLLEKQIPETEGEIAYLENILFTIENVEEVEEVDEIKDELIAEGYIRSSAKNKKSKKPSLSKPHHYVSQDNLNIFVGKNNRQNEDLTFKQSHKEDLWLHVQGIPGSHVIIEGRKNNIPDSTLKEAGLLAAYYSKARMNNNVAVDYTERKYVRKPRNGKIGMAIYENFKTLIVSPSKEMVEEIKKVE